MSENPMIKAALLMASIVVIVVLCCEWYLRSSGFPVAFDDGPPLWSDKRDKIYTPSDKTVVFIGSSRIKFDLNIALWEQLTGTHAVQLACVGSSPRPILENLANDPDFKGRLIVDVTEGLFFSNKPNNVEKPNESIKYYLERTPAQRVSFHLNRIMESVFVFLDKERFALDARLDALQIASREGVRNPPVFAIDFGWTTFDREDFMLARFVGDTVQQNQVKAIWDGFNRGPKPPPMTEEEIVAVLRSVKEATDKIKSRGGEVVFIRTPSNGSNLEREKTRFPREKFWDRILTYTGCQGYHYTDYKPVDQLVCPENSHLGPEGAVVYTRHLVEILEQEQHWKFPTTKL